MNNYRTYYTLEDCLDYVEENYTSPLDTRLYLCSLLDLCFTRFKSVGYLSEVLETYGINQNDLYALEISTRDVNITPYTKLFRLILLRYGNEYLPSKTDEEINDYLSSEEFFKWGKRFVGILCESKEKYVNILNIYSDNISKLMNPLKTTHSEESERNDDFDVDVTSQENTNDTPTTTDVVATIEGNQFVSALTKGTGHTDNVGSVTEERSSTTEVDSATTMARIKEIEDSYQKVLYNWSNEFGGLFIEEDNL